LPIDPPSVSARLTASKTEKFSQHFLIARPQNYFQLRKRKFFCFAFLLTQELRKRFPPLPRFRRGAGGQKFFPSNSPNFCPPAGRKNFCDGGVYFSITKINKVDKAHKTI